MVLDYTAKSIRAYIVCRCVFVALLDIDLCKKYVKTIGFPHKQHGSNGYMNLKGCSLGTRQNIEYIVWFTY